LIGKIDKRKDQEAIAFSRISAWRPSDKSRMLPSRHWKKTLAVVRISVKIPTIWPGHFSLEIATAVAGSIIGINPFTSGCGSQQIETRKLTRRYERLAASR